MFNFLKSLKNHFGLQARGTQDEELDRKMEELFENIFGPAKKVEDKGLEKVYTTNKPKP
jgi:hypothetical protein